MVGVPAAGEHRVQLLAAFGAGREAVHRVDRHALGGVHGGRVAEFGRGGDVVGGQDHAASAAGVEGAEATVGVMAVMVQRSPFLTQSVGHAEAAVVGAGDDHVADRRGEAVGELHLASGRGAGEAVGAGAGVEFGDEVAGGGEHDRVQPGGAVGLPGVEDLVGDGGQVADVDALPVEVEAERFGLSVAQGQAGAAFGGVGEADEFVQPGGAVAGGDVAQDAAGADRGELLVVADEPDAAAAGEDVADGGVQGEGVGHAGFVDHHQGVRADLGGPVGQITVVDRPGELGEGVGVGVDLRAQGGRRRSGRREAQHGAAGLGPRRGEGPHRGRLAGAGGGDRDLDAGARAGHGPHQRDLAGVQLDAVRRALRGGRRRWWPRRRPSHRAGRRHPPGVVRRRGSAAT